MVELAPVIIFAPVVLGVLWFALRRITFSTSWLPSFSGMSIKTALKYSMWAVIAIWLVLFTPLGRGIFTFTETTATVAGCGLQQAADDLSKPCLERAEAKEAKALEINVARVQRQSVVELARRQATAPVSTEHWNVQVGCASARYISLERCWTVTLPPNTFYIHTLDPTIEGARCDRHAPAMNSLKREYPSASSTKITNTGNDHEVIYVYEVFQGDIGPDKVAC